ncbi:hypothetical protein PPL_02877 [Heterostelium album PN500]|uniref:protein-tyrosine-phosphatase n=1 Tax=Heterostelium pallidum (strain ATCC 26659 / Pp 5 / PN500) TaxID=670386 RepID=D3B3B1_HETP5|nr:hypothetical protein PPL_02877 [Heterostelium album PN500]EFA83809.1 hypothetical protein PPL_02877 [Heterostelium album PN500]|eukprot:XP_020435926.1 hypothetical protein PPL_02877 [Heterostelium album PN500]
MQSNKTLLSNGKEDIYSRSKDIGKTLNELLEEAEIPASDLKDHRYHEATTIFPHLYLGGVGACTAQNLQKLGVTLVINVAEECSIKKYDPNEGITELKLIIHDRVDEPQFQSFHKLFHEIDLVEKKNTKCIVHCMRGRSRSATVVIAYVMYKLKLDLNNAFQYVKTKRTIIGPHGDLKKQLLQFERYFLKTESNTLWHYLLTPVESSNQNQQPNKPINKENN